MTEIIQNLEFSLQNLLNENVHSTIYLISFHGEIDGRAKGSWGIGIHFDDTNLPGGVRHERLTPNGTNTNGLSLELASALEKWVRDINSRLKVPRPPRIEIYAAG